MPRFHLIVNTLAEPLDPCLMVSSISIKHGAKENTVNTSKENIVNQCNIFPNVCVYG